MWLSTILFYGSILAVGAMSGMTMLWLYHTFKPAQDTVSAETVEQEVTS